VAPENICYYTLIDETLNYTTRFQNTGNDVAYKVLVTDMLDANFDLNTFQLISSSHPEVLNTTISDGGLVSFEFNEINLPDSATNLIESQGYINYSIKTKSDIRDNTLIENASNIYFDANPPIETNTVKNVMVSTIPNYIWCFDRDGDGLGDPTQMRISCGAKPDGLVADCTDDDDTVVSINSTLYPHLLIYPNPTKGIFKIKGIPFEEATVSLYNSAGLKVEPSVSQNKEALFKYSNLKNGVYYIEIEIDDRIVRRKIVVIQ